ncbi:methyltransferase domain-containing protein [Gammaproteobacteria bacterium LSUCC0112]|nr:methyltransferase domain-containing protein [Gammaproteobacteria bacterium LSUCC0112]
MTKFRDQKIGIPSNYADEILNALANRKSFRRFLSTPLEDTLIDSLIADCIGAPTACNHQMHHFVVVSDQDLKRRLQKISGSNDHFISASHLIVICFQKGWNHNKFAVVQSTAALAYHLCLSAHLRGVGSVWNAGIGNSDDVRDLLEIPATFEVIGVICLGWPDESLENTKAPRRGVDVVRSYGVFQRPSDHVYPLKSSKKYPYWRIKNNDNPYAVHDPQSWTLGQIREWRAHAVYAKSPTPGIFVSRRLGSEMFHEVSSIGEISPGERILEIMPFAGSYTVLLHQRLGIAAELHVTDLSTLNLDFTAERLRNERGTDAIALAKAMDSLRLPYEDASFDAVFMPQIIESLPDPWDLVQEAFRVLRPGGRLGLSIRNVNSWFGIYFLRQTGKGQVTNFGPYRPIPVSQWRKRLAKVGKIEEEFGVSPIPSRIGQRAGVFMLRYSRIWVARLRKLN